MFTDAGPYLEYFKSLPNDINKLRDLVCAQHMHKHEIYERFTKQDIGKNFAWMNCLHEYLHTAVSMSSEIFRLNPQGFIFDKPANEKIVTTCRYIAILFAAILKAKNIPARCRSGFAPYIDRDIVCDHWICEYWSEKENRWIAIDPEINSVAHCSKNVNLYDVGNDFVYAAHLWLRARENKEDISKYATYRECKDHLQSIAHALLLDFHALMNYELGYRNVQMFIYGDNFSLKEEDLQDIDNLAKLMLNPDENFKALRSIWENEEKFRCLMSPYTNPYIGK